MGQVWKGDHISLSRFLGPDLGELVEYALFILFQQWP